MTKRTLKNLFKDYHGDYRCVELDVSPVMPTADISTAIQTVDASTLKDNLELILEQVIKGNKPILVSTDVECRNVVMLPESLYNELLSNIKEG